MCAQLQSPIWNYTTFPRPRYSNKNTGAATIFRAQDRGVRGVEDQNKKSQLDLKKSELDLLDKKPIFKKERESGDSVDESKTNKPESQEEKTEVVEQNRTLVMNPGNLRIESPKSLRQGNVRNFSS